MEQPQFNVLSQELAPLLQTIEAKRREFKIQGNKRGLVVAIILLIIGGSATCIWGYGSILLPLTLLFSLIIYYVLVKSKEGYLTEYYKKEIIPRLVRTLCANAIYSPKDGIDEQTFCNSGLFTRPDRYYSEDLIKGQVGSTSFLCSEVRAQERHTQVDSKGRTKEYWEDIFDGFLFIADFHKDFRGRTTIKRNSFLKFGHNYPRVKMENPDFEKVFDVYSTDQVEARYLITPSMMERLLEMNRKLNKNITFSFWNSMIFIAIPDSVNHFEISIWKPIDDKSRLKSEFDTILSLIAIVNDLNLNTRIWSKV